MSEHDLSAVVRAARRAQGAGERVVLATVVATRGSTYRKAGARMLLGRDAPLAGIVGGGCFDADLLEQARQVATGRSRLLTYDMQSPEDAIWGLGLGCEGAVDLLLQSDEHTRCALDLLDLADDQSARRLATSIDPQHAGFGITRNWSPDQVGHEFFVEDITPPPRLLVCGAGVDARPLVRLAAQCGWCVVVLDHRSAHAVPDRFPEALSVAAYEGGVLPPCEAAVLMSHSLHADVAYLKALAVDPPAYIGALGPTARRALLVEQAAIDPGLGKRIRGPAGLDLGGELPESIALSMMAELEAAYRGGNGRPWTGQGRK